jgi:glycosyltransferase involved in cell wall biosynthesis
MSILSIIIPFYNSEKTIGRALDSLNRMSRKSKEQTEVVIVNDGSRDRGAEIVESKKNGLSPLTVVLIRQENQGSAGARNTGLEHSSGEWIFFLDADDELAFDPVPYILKSSDFSAIGFLIQWYKKLRKWRVLRPTLINLRNHLEICTASVPFSLSNIVFKKDHLTTLFDERLLFLEDWVFWIQNPNIFENMKIYKDVISAHIYAHGENKSSNYMMLGKYRKEIADEMLMTLQGKLTQKQKNNLLIQAQIGLLLQGGKMKMKNFFRFPCDMTLFGKLIVYFVLRRNFSKFDIYGFKK